jgi:hypothetical protein
LRSPEFLRLGLADGTPLGLCGEEHLLLSMDLDLWIAAECNGLAVRNFHHLRTP